MVVDKFVFIEVDLEVYKYVAVKRGVLILMINYYCNIFFGLLN